MWLPCRNFFCHAGASRVLAAKTEDKGNKTDTIVLETLKRSKGLAGSESYMSPEMLEVVEALRTGALSGHPDIPAKVGIMLWVDRVDGCVIARIGVARGSRCVHAGVCLTSRGESVVCVCVCVAADASFQ